MASDPMKASEILILQNCLLETVPKKSEKMLSKNLLETKSIIFSELFKV